ncbi:60S ribosomal protein L17-2-like protein [Tanacetum coccineum]
MLKLANSIASSSYNREGQFQAITSSYAYKEVNEFLVYLLVFPLSVGITLFTGVTTTPATRSSNVKQLNGHAHLAINLKKHQATNTNKGITVEVAEEEEPKEGVWVILLRLGTNTRMGQGRWTAKSSKLMLDLLKNTESNAEET